MKDQSGSGGNVKAEFKYNGLGYRISARYDETAPWFHFAYDERWRTVAMYEDDADPDSPTEQFWYQNAGVSGMGGSSYIDDVILRDRQTGASEGGFDERRYYLQNWHHDVVAIIDTSGSIVERANYDVYGSPIGTFTAIGNRKGYAGYEYDEKISTGGASGSHTYHVRHRVYRSDLGVWTRRDPLPDTNLYRYALGSPLTYVDPEGLIVEYLDSPYAPRDCSDWDKANPPSQWTDPTDVPDNGPDEWLPVYQYVCPDFKFPPGMALADCYCWERRRIKDQYGNGIWIAVADCADWALRASRQWASNPEERNNLRHCIYACCLNDAVGRVRARDILWAHECCFVHTKRPFTDDDWNDTIRDWEWNTVGLKCKVELNDRHTECLDCCRKALRKARQPKDTNASNGPKEPARGAEV